jgi:hypothetical protein
MQANGEHALRLQCECGASGRRLGQRAMVCAPRGRCFEHGQSLRSSGVVRRWLASVSARLASPSRLLYCRLRFGGVVRDLYQEGKRRNSDGRALGNASTEASGGALGNASTEASGGALGKREHGGVWRSARKREHGGVWRSARKREHGGVWKSALRGDPRKESASQMPSKCHISGGRAHGGFYRVAADAGRSGECTHIV